MPGIGRAEPGYETPKPLVVRERFSGHLRRLAVKARDQQRPLVIIHAGQHRYQRVLDSGVSGGARRLLRVTDSLALARRWIVDEALYALAVAESERRLMQ